MNTTTARRRIVASFALAVALVACFAFGGAPTYAHTAAVHAKKHLNWVQRHPTATSVAAAIAAHHALKVMAARDKARGKKLNWAERHPTMTAVGAGVVAHHEIKKHTPR